MSPLPPDTYTPSISKLLRGPCSQLWNLPPETLKHYSGIQAFKSDLNTFLFKEFDASNYNLSFSTAVLHMNLFHIPLIITTICYI